MSESASLELAFLIGNLNKEHGGAQRLLYDICRHLPGDEFDATVYYMFGDGTFRPHFEDEGIEVIDLDATSNYDVSAYRRLVGLLRASDHDLLQTNSPISGVWGRTAGRLAGVDRVVSVEHNVHHAYRLLTRVANGVTLPLADEVVGVSGTVTDSLLPWERPLLHGTGVRTIVNGVDTTVIEAHFDDREAVLAEHTDLEPDDVIVGSVGRFVEQKGYEYLLRGFPAVREHHPDAQLLLVGDGPRRDHLESLAASLDVESAVTFTGRILEVYPLLPAFDVAAFPSLWEGLPLAPAEAMVANAPLVASDIEPIRELAGDAALFVPPKDHEAIANSIVALLDSEERRRELGTRARERVSSSFAIEGTAEEYAAMYRELVDGG